MSIFAICSSMSHISLDFPDKSISRIELSIQFIAVLYFFITIVLITKKMKISIILIKIYYITSIIISLLMIMIVLTEFNLFSFLWTIFTIISSSLWLIYFIKSKRVKYTLTK